MSKPDFIKDLQERRDAGLISEKDAMRAGYKHALKTGMPIVTMSFTASGPVGPGLPHPEGVPINFALKQAATMEFQGRAPPSDARDGRGNFKGEAAYRAYHEDLVADRATWEPFFDEPMHSEHAEHACGILGTLATLLRQRGSLEECEAVLDCEAWVIAIYGRHCRAGTSRAALRCHDGLHYKYMIIRTNLYGQQGRFRECVPLFRALCHHELDYDVQNDMYLWLIFAVLHKRPAKKTVDRMTDDECVRCVRMPFDAAGKDFHEQENKQPKVTLATCAACGSTEPALCTFARCAGCKKVSYCGPECQKTHWKAHKKACKEFRAGKK